MKVHTRLIVFFSSLTTFMFILAQTVLGQAEFLKTGTDDKGNVTTDLANPNSAYGLLGNLISTLIYIIIIGGALTAFVFFIIGAIQWGTAGSGDGAANGRKTMIYAAAGLVTVALVYVFMIFFNNILPGAPTNCNSSIDPGCQ